LQKKNPAGVHSFIRSGRHGSEPIMFAYIAIFVTAFVWFGVQSELTAPRSYDENEFDSYNSNECKRVRRPWSKLTSEERQSYKEAILKLREDGGGDIDKDDLIAVGSEHEHNYGEIVHQASTYLFWHGYLLWELESRIRNLGGKWACFGMPYWDFSMEADRPDDQPEPLIFDDDANFLGGDGDKENSFNVNGYSWDVTTEEYWVPAHCTAKGDAYPICSLKRSTNKEFTAISADLIGEGIRQYSSFKDFSTWYADTFNLPHSLLIDDESLRMPVVTSYDPIWYLFHSMVSYHQGIWQDCHDYDLIHPDDLDTNKAAYSGYCSRPECGDMDLDGHFVYEGMLPVKPWAFVHSKSLTVRMSYHQPRWNVLYDLDGDDFFTKSGLHDFCRGKLNENWFVLRDDNGNVINDEYNAGAAQIDSEQTVETEDAAAAAHFLTATATKSNMNQEAVVMIGLTMAVSAFAACYKCQTKKSGSQDVSTDVVVRNGYGSV